MQRRLSSRWNGQSAHRPRPGGSGRKPLSYTLYYWVMKLLEKKQKLTVTDYPLGFLLFGVFSMGIALYVLMKGDIPNFFMALLVSLVFSLYGKKRELILDKNKGSFQFKEKNIFGESIIIGLFDDIEDINIHYGRGRTVTPSGFISVRLKNGKKFALNEYGKLLFGENKNPEALNKISEYINIANHST